MSTETKPKVLIVGAGLGGLMLGALLEKANIPYTIFERASIVKPLGSAHLIGPSLMPLFAQLGIEDEFIALGKPTMNSAISRENEGPLLTVDYQSQVEYTGYHSYVIARSTLHELLLKQVPSHKVLYGKRVVFISEEDDKVTIQTADESTYEGDILVGADGAYSAVRQRLYERLKKDDKLSKADQEDLPYSAICLAGQTKVIDFNDFPEFQNPSLFNNLGKDKPYSWMVMATSQDTICWLVMHHLDQAASKRASDQCAQEPENPEWGPQATQTMCDETRNFPISIGAQKFTMGDIYEWTPKEQMSKITLEEKVFETWHSGRTVLLGDACHKMNPSGAQGAVIAMHDALALANLLYALPSNSSAEIDKALVDYKKERIGPAIEAYNNSRMASKFMERGVTGRVALIIMRHLPTWVFDMATKRMILNRPQIGWMQQIENKGSVSAVVSPSTEKAGEAFRQRTSAASV
ncbi:hypothetical protein BGX23_009658 [Mortierella sp. AD031]|nr:hypothetical protein BGX23_009658 [Mortierella sp. AD031]